MTHEQWINLACISFSAAMLIGLLTLTWAVCQMSQMCSADEERDDYIFDDAEEFPHWDASDSECEKTDPYIQLTSTGRTTPPTARSVG